LRESQKARSASRKLSRIFIGYIVILKDDFTKRAFWKLAIVDSLLTGSDGEVRTTVVRVSRPEGNPMLLHRSVKHLYPLEVSPVDTTTVNEETQDREATDQDETTENTSTTRDTVVGKQRKSAAVAGELKRRLNMLN